MIRWFLRRLAHFCFRRRYKLIVEGLEQCKEERSVLFLPNHVSPLDPVLLLLLLEERFHPKPLAMAPAFDLPVIGGILRSIGAIPIPDFDLGGNEYTRLMAERSIQAIAEGLKEGKNYLVYPAGRLKRSAREELRGSSAAFEILQHVPEVNLVLVRTEGLWGSSFSIACMGSFKRLPQALGGAIKKLLLNGLFFMPKRPVKITFAAMRGLPLTDKTRLNQSLEGWYNAQIEPLRLVREYFWSSKLPECFPVEVSHQPASNHSLSPEKQSLLFQEIRRISKQDKLFPSQHLNNDLGLDSLDAIELITALSDHFETGHIQPSDLTTIENLSNLLANPLVMKEEERAQPLWPEEQGRPAIAIGGADHLLTLFFEQVARLGPFAAAADDQGKPLSYREVRQKAFLLAEILKEFPEKRIGIMLPATTTSTLLILACWIADKVPVEINWTIGHRFLKSTTELVGVQRVITSKRFVYSAKSMDLLGIDDRLLFLEELKAKAGRWRALSWMLLGRFHAWRGIKRTLNPEEEAVVLFTSGTESQPKAVPLTHKNLSSNQRAALACIPFESEKGHVMLGFLPPFHSFGFSITGLLPLLIGLRVVYTPDPTDGMRLLQATKRWQVTVICAAPTFLQTLLHRAGPEGLHQVRYFVSGAEKTPDSLFAAIARFPNSLLLEGYGITECAPILTINRFERVREGVGYPLPNVELLIVDPESKQPLPQGTQGLILARGPNIFKGYLNPDVAPPFLQLNGLSWYITGDLGYFTPSGALILAGRLKRFVKMGAEMINLPAVEEALKTLFAKELTEPALAVTAIEKGEERPRLILHTTLSLDRDRVNEALWKAGFSRIVKIDAINDLSSIPLLGTGKIDYQTLQRECK